MKSRFLMSTAVLALALSATVATAQTVTDPAKPVKTDALDRNGNPIRVIDTSRPAAAQAAPASAPAATAQNAPAAAPSTTQQSATPSVAPAPPLAAPATAQTTPAPAPATTAATPPAPAAQPGAPATAQNAPAATQPSTASTATPAQPNTTQPAVAQPAATPPTAAPPATAQQTPPANNQAATTTTQPPARLSASLQVEQKTRLTRAFTSVDAKPITNATFSVSVGSTVPRTADFRPLPASVVSIIPQYRGYNYVLVRNDIVIIEPGTARIVDVIERGSPAQARTTAATTERKANLSRQQRDALRQDSTRRTTTVTTGSAPRVTRRVMVGDRVPDDVELREMPEEVYRDAPSVRSYRYMRGERGVYLVDPRRRTIIEDYDDDY